MKKQDELDFWVAIWNHADGQPYAVIPTFEISESLDIPFKRALYLVRKWFGHGLVECGVNENNIWLTEKGTLVQSF